MREGVQYITGICREAAIIVNPNESEFYRERCVVPLMVGTCAQESHFRYRRQLSFLDNPDSINGAFGLFQTERWSACEGVDWLNRHKPDLLPEKGLDLAQPEDAHKLLYSLTERENDLLAAVLCRLHYKRIPHPNPRTVLGQAKYWKDHYNTHLGKGKVSEYVYNWFTRVRGDSGLVKLG